MSVVVIIETILDRSIANSARYMNNSELNVYLVLSKSFLQGPPGVGIDGRNTAALSLF
ncbi:hypothetical protein QGM71_17680 [Virgibacillus sp. C22-A2]|uniref:Uncharacterized protein n=1 Tax=Virgibacillus tibetensis TaxID=3042313 RepID=A0ABU6KJK1_9BACI|nr:hypothetical protein [Virgibacillus sp. C22-A2]